MECRSLTAFLIEVEMIGLKIRWFTALLLNTLLFPILILFYGIREYSRDIFRHIDIYPYTPKPPMAKSNRIMEYPFQSVKEEYSDDGED
jgi:hypothetical protein